MTSQSETILIIGGTSGIGEALTRYYFSKGKKMIVTGRRAERLERLSKELPGLETRQGDIRDIAHLEDHANRLVTEFPTIDTVIVNAGIQESFFFADPTSSSTASISNEITTNFIAPSILCRVFIPHLRSLKREGTLITVSSGLGFVPLPFYPVYSATKAAIHALSVALRAQIAGTNVNIVELVPPYVDTALDAGHREKIANMLPGSVPVPMSMEAFMQEAVEGLETRDGNGKPLKEVGVGRHKPSVKAWNDAIRPILQRFGIDA